jgi:hypothetical protein
VLEDGLYAQVERSAKALLQHGLDNGNRGREMKRKLTKETICPCCGESMDLHRGHVPCSSTEPIAADNRYYWLSYADEDRFCGVAIVECTDGDPVQKTWELGIKPGKTEDCSVVFQPL